MTNLDDLQTWFMSTNQTEWNLYRGHQEKLNALHLIANQRAELSQDESWEALRNFIEMNTRGGGDVTVFVPIGQNNRGYLAHYSAAGAANGMAGIGMPGAIGAWGMGYIPEAEAERRMNEMRAKMELERRIEDLEAERESQQGLWGPIIKDALSGIDLNSLIKMAYVGMMAKFSPGTIQPQVSISGMEAQPALQNLEDEDEEDHPVDVFVARIRPAFQSDDQLYLFLNKVADFFVKNPQLCVDFFTKN